MKKSLLRTLTVLTGLGWAYHPLLASTYALDPQFDCHSDAHTFITALKNDQYINSDPMHVEANSVNAFRPTHSSDLTVFGFRVYMILGFAHDDPLFKMGSGEAIAGSLYGAVVSGSSETVETKVREVGSNAVVRQVLPLLLTAIVCEGN
jgi:hypothetical protein